MRTMSAAIACLAGMGLASTASATCNAVSPSDLQNAYPGLRPSVSAILAPALSDVAAMNDAEQSARSSMGNRERRALQLRQQLAQYDAQRQAQRRPVNFRNSRSLMQSLLQRGPADPPYIVAAREELKALERAPDDRGQRADALLAGADDNLAGAIDRLSRDLAGQGSYRMLVDADRLMRERLADCAAWRSRAGGSLPRSLAALDQYDRDTRGALGAAATAITPRLKAEIGSAADSGTLQAIRRDYMGTPAAMAAMEATGVAQAWTARQTAVLNGERAVATAAQARRDEAAARAARAAAAEQARANAAEQALLARQRGAQGGGTGGSRAAAASRNPGTGEPTEAQMRAALQANAARIATRMGMGDWAKITYFEKVGCDRAQGRAGWMCDYLSRADGNPVMGIFDALAGPGTAMRGSARFILRANGWDAFPDQSGN